MEIERSPEPITIEDLKELYNGSAQRLHEYFVKGQGVKWKELYNIEKLLAIALCQGGAIHFHDGVNGIK